MQNMMKSQVFSCRLESSRCGKGLTQADVADEAGLSLRQYQRYEQGEADPPLSKAYAMARVLGVSLDYLTGLSEGL